MLLALHGGPYFRRNTLRPPVASRRDNSQRKQTRKASELTRFSESATTCQTAEPSGVENIAHVQIPQGP